MTLLTDPALLDGGPGVHVLIVAVGQYPYLDGGGDPNPLPNPGGLGQLTSPVPSAAAFLEWLRTEFTPHSVPLKSIELVSSPGVFRNWENKETAVDRPNMKNVSDAIKAWAKRGDTSADSVLMMYFCGHGVSNGDVHSLLLENFGEDQDDPFNTGAIDAQRMMNGVRGKQASKQLFILDACRTINNDAFKRYGEEIRGVPVISGNALARLDTVEQAALWASQLQAPAYGNPGLPSVFMAAMLHAMQGAGAVQDEIDGRWVISPELLKLAINFLIQRHTGHADLQFVELQGTAKPIKIHRLKDEPKVPVTVRCKPEEKHSLARFSCSSGDERPVGMAAPWYLDLQLNMYTFSAMFDDIGTKSSYKPVLPPCTYIFIDTQK